jgi:hypothetical protein
VTIQAQLLAPFMFINFGLAALLDGTHVTIRLLKTGAMPITFFHNGADTAPRPLNYGLSGPSLRSLFTSISRRGR